jgi:HSP20 family protein
MTFQARCEPSRFESYGEMARFQRRMHRYMQQEAAGREESHARFAPPVDIYEDEHSYTLKLDVAGIDEKDIDIKLENSTLTISGERKFESEEKTENYRRVERRYGRFGRAFTLPQTIDGEAVTAKYDKGVLKIRLVKKTEAKPKQIKINVGGSDGEKAAETQQG